MGIIRQQFTTAFMMLVLTTLLLGLVYPACVTLVSQFAYPDKANGSLVIKDNKIIGSALIGQSVTDVRYFWGRPSATAQFPNNAMASGASNLGATNPILINTVADRIKMLLAIDPEHQVPPADLIMASASGLDPDIHIEAAYYQVPRIAKTRGVSKDKLNALIKSLTEVPLLGIFGEAKVNVLKLNLALDSQEK